MIENLPHRTELAELGEFGLIDYLTNSLRERGAKNVEATVGWGDERAIGFIASQGWQQQVRVYSRSLLPPEPQQPRNWRAKIRARVKRLKLASRD